MLPWAHADLHGAWRARPDRLDLPCPGGHLRRLCRDGRRHRARAALVLAAAGGARGLRRHDPGLPLHRPVLRHLAAARRRHAGDDPGRPARAVGVPKHDRHREGVRLCPRRAVRDALRLLCGLFQSQPRLPGNVPRRLRAWSPPRADAGGQPALAAGLRRAVRIRVQPPVTELVPDDHPSDGLDPAAVRGGRRHPGRRQPPLAVCRQRR